MNPKIFTLSLSAILACLLLARDAGAGEPPAAGAVIVTRDASGRVSRIEGPGISVRREPATAPRVPDGDAAANPARPGGARPERQPPARMRLQSPVVCLAGERRELADVEIVAEASGVIARRGCTLHLSGVEVRAGGWGLVVEDGARVRIDASVIAGRTGSVDAAPGASLSAWSTVFLGPPGQRMLPPQFVDRGGNAWD